MENDLNQVVVINEQGKYIFNEGSTWDLYQIKQMFRQSQFSSCWNNGKRISVVGHCWEMI